MKFWLLGKREDSNLTKVVGVLPIRPDAPFNEEKVIASAKKMQEEGAEYIEIGVRSEDGISSEQTEAALLVPAVRVIRENTMLHVGVFTSYPSIMEKAHAQGAEFIADCLSLRREGSVEMAAKLQIPVLLLYGEEHHPENDETYDPVAQVHEFLYERIDACLNAGLPRKLIMIDPTLGPNATVDSRLKMMGRLISFKSFALPICVEIPRVLPAHDDFTGESNAVAIALAVFCASEGVAFIRTNNVAEMSLALATWQLAKRKTKPYQLTRGLIRRMSLIRKHVRERRVRSID